MELPLQIGELYVSNVDWELHPTCSDATAPYNSWARKGFKYTEIKSDSWFVPLEIYHTTPKDADSIYLWAIIYKIIVGTTGEIGWIVTDKDDPTPFRKFNDE